MDDGRRSATQQREQEYLRGWHLWIECGPFMGTASEHWRNLARFSHPQKKLCEFAWLLAEVLQRVADSGRYEPHDSRLRRRTERTPGLHQLPPLLQEVGASV